MNELEIQQIVFEILSEVAPELDSLSELEADQNLRDQVDLDSMDYLNFLTHLSERFKVKISESDYEMLISLNDFVKFLTANRV